MKKFITAFLILFSLTATAQNVGIGTNTPSEKLEVIGTLKSDTVKTDLLTIAPNAGTGKVLASDANGNAGWLPGKSIPGTIALAGSMNGQAKQNLPTASNVYEFVGPTAIISVNGSQRIIVNSTAALGRLSAGGADFRLDVGYQLGTGAINNFAAGNYIMHREVFTTSQRHSFSATGSIKPAAGTYTIGLIIYGTTVGALNYNDFVNSSFLIINE